MVLAQLGNLDAIGTENDDGGGGEGNQLVDTEDELNLLDRVRLDVLAHPAAALFLTACWRMRSSGRVVPEICVQCNVRLKTKHQSSRVTMRGKNEHLCFNSG